MLGRTFGLAAVLVLQSLATAVSQEPVRWQAYANEAYDYAVAVPLGMFQIEETPGGLTLLESEGRGQIDVYGARNTAGYSVSEFARVVASADRIREVTYRRSGRNWLVLSGYYNRDDASDDLIFYAKFMFSPEGDRLSAFEASYPVSDKVRYDALIERMEDSLTSPD